MFGCRSRKFAKVVLRSRGFGFYLQLIIPHKKRKRKAFTKLSRIFVLVYVRKTRQTLLAALTGDVLICLLSAVAVGMLFYQ
jgi:hypothetical protein